MSLHEMKGLTPHLQETDLERFTGLSVLGEPLPLLMSAVLRLRLVSLKRGLATVAGSLSQEERAALTRAMGRTGIPFVDDGEDDARRLVAVVRETCQAADVAVATILRLPA
jgi:hypothetical protein